MSKSPAVEDPRSFVSALAAVALAALGIVTVSGCGPVVASPSTAQGGEAGVEGATVADGKGTGLKDHDAKLAKQLVREQGALLLDVRSQGEFDSGHVEGATLVPVDELESRLGEIETATGGDKTKPIVVYCRSGRRSATAKQALLAAGYTQVSDLGGMSSWCETC
jgi:rhodanese-related sulfurtransferase